MNKSYPLKMNNRNKKNNKIIRKSNTIMNKSYSLKMNK